MKINSKLTLKKYHKIRKKKYKKNTQKNMSRIRKRRQKYYNIHGGGLLDTLNFKTKQ